MTRRPAWLDDVVRRTVVDVLADDRRELARLGGLGVEAGRLRSRPVGDGRHWGSTSGAAPTSGPTTRTPDLFDQPTRIVITRRRCTWSIRLDIAGGLLVHRRDDGGPYALTRRRAEAKGRRMLSRYLRAAARPTEEHIVDPSPAAPPDPYLPGRYRRSGDGPDAGPRR
jgi:hypothetical protein